ncbi:hypothetical protein [Microcystis sp.]|jgi:hypothetical protein|uniref:hypothetical protein n=1 Tax=Microcystis sp. TaxID=1127 RepID=UPI003AF6D064
MIEKVLTRFFRAIPYFLIGVIFAWFISGFWIHGTPSTLLIKIIENRVIFLGILSAIMASLKIRLPSELRLPSEHGVRHSALQWMGSFIGLWISSVVISIVLIIFPNIILSMAVNGAVKLLAFGLAWKLIAVLLLSMLVIFILLILTGALGLLIFYGTMISELIFELLNIGPSFFLEDNNFIISAMFLWNPILLLLGIFTGVNLARSLIL